VLASQAKPGNAAARALGCRAGLGMQQAQQMPDIFS